MVMSTKFCLRRAAAVLFGLATLVTAGCVSSGYVRDYPRYYPNGTGAYYPNGYYYPGPYAPHRHYPYYNGYYLGGYYPGYFFGNYYAYPPGLYYPGPGYVWTPRPHRDVRDPPADQHHGQRPRRDRGDRNDRAVRIGSGAIPPAPQSPSGRAPDFRPARPNVNANIKEDDGSSAGALGKEPPTVKDPPTVAPRLRPDAPERNRNVP